ncbi:hypothetical protein FRC11_011719 [Ceratobasidium sp. 423]|nr:hypothetical protein FRC11_011719 [Ceratobasidium sp. 423]
MFELPVLLKPQAKDEPYEYLQFVCKVCGKSVLRKIGLFETVGLCKHQNRHQAQWALRDNERLRTRKQFAFAAFIALFARSTRSRDTFPVVSGRELQTNPNSPPLAMPHHQPYTAVNKSIKPATQTHSHLAYKSAPANPCDGHELTAEICSRYISLLFSPPDVLLPTAQAVVSPTLAEFIAYALRQTRLSLRIPYRALLLLRRLKTCVPGARASSGHRLFLAAFIVASKSARDNAYSIGAWCAIAQGMFSGRDVSLMERQLCQYLDWNLCIKPEDLRDFELMLREQHGLFNAPSVPVICVTSPPASPQVIRVMSPRQDAPLSFSTSVASPEAPKIIRFGSGFVPQEGPHVGLASSPTPVAIPSSTGPSTSVAAPEPPQIIRLGLEFVPQGGHHVVLVSSPTPVAAPVPPSTAPSEPPHVLRVGGSVSQDGPQVIRVTSASQTVVAPPPASEPRVFHIGASVPQDGPQVNRVTSPPAPIVVAPHPEIAAEPQVFRISTPGLQEGPQLIRITSLAPASVIASVPAAPIVSELPHVVRIGASVPQDGPQVIRVTSPAPVVAALVALEPPHVVRIGGSSPQEGPQIARVIWPVVAPAVPVPATQVARVTNTLAEPVPTAPTSIDPASTQPTIVRLGTSEPVQPQINRITSTEQEPVPGPSGITRHGLGPANQASNQAACVTPPPPVGTPVP